MSPVDLPIYCALQGPQKKWIGLHLNVFICNWRERKTNVWSSWKTVSYIYGSFSILERRHFTYAKAGEGLMARFEEMFEKWKLELIILCHEKRFLCSHNENFIVLFLSFNNVSPSLHLLPFFIILFFLCINFKTFWSHPRVRLTVVVCGVYKPQTLFRCLYYLLEDAL